jgi:hypothetical protein
MIPTKKGKKTKKEKLEIEETRDTATTVLGSSVSQTGLSKASRQTYVDQL